MVRSVTSIRQTIDHCDGCHCEPSCLYKRVFLPGLEDFEVSTKSRTLHRGENVFSQQDLAQGLYVVKSGSFKSYFSNPEGIEQISAYHFPGDLLGYDSLESGHHTTSVAALETASVCQLPSEIMSGAPLDSRVCFNAMMRIMARQVTERETHTFVISNFSTKQRLAWFLFKITESLGARNLDRTVIQLSMSRQDIANYLAMAVETVSRVFTEFESEGILKVERKMISITCPQALADLGNILPEMNEALAGSLGASCA